MTRQFNLLVVDDDLAVRESITRVLEAEGYQVSSAASCPDAIHEFDRKPIDMVILDLNLGKEEGWRAFHALKERRPSLPIIVTSGKADELRHSAVEHASGVLEKPFDMPVLLTILKQASPMASSLVSLLPPSGNAIASTEDGRFPDTISTNVPEPEQLRNVRSAQVVETKHQTLSSPDGMPPATAVMLK
jgi:DNA-binding response OmpR family regulator